MFCRHGAAEARGAHNPEDTGSKPVAGLLFFLCFKETQMSLTRDKTYYRCGAEAARVAHNHYVTRSKRVVGIFTKII